jgi:hypothetical protein
MLPDISTQQPTLCARAAPPDLSEVFANILKATLLKIAKKTKNAKKSTVRHQPESPFSEDDQPKQKDSHMKEVTSALSMYFLLQCKYFIPRFSNTCATLIISISYTAIISIT